MGQQNLILYIAATMVAAIVLLMLFGVQRQVQDASVDALQYRMAKQDMLNVVRMVQRDVRNMGSYMYWDEAQSKFVGDTFDPEFVIRNEWYDSTQVAGGWRYELQFYTQPDSISAPAIVQYVWEPNGRTVTLSDGTVRDLLTLERHVDGSLSGWSDSITQIDVRFRPHESQPSLFNLWDTRRIDINMHGVSSMGTAETIEETRFEASYRPVGIAIADQAVN